MLPIVKTTLDEINVLIKACILSEKFREAIYYLGYRYDEEKEL
jgi:hypothetical protein